MTNAFLYDSICGLVYRCMFAGVDGCGRAQWVNITPGEEPKTLEDYVADATFELRYNPLDKLYFSALAGVITADDKIGGLLKDPLPDIFAFGAQAAYDTIVGPVKFNVHWSNVKGWGAYIGVGFDF